MLPDWRGVDGEWNEIVNLLSRVLPYLRSKSWETRQAAGEAVDAIAKAVGIWDPSLTERTASDTLETLAESKVSCADPVDPNIPNRIGLTFDTFDLDAVLREGTILLSSAGKEFDRSTNPRSQASLVAAKRDVASKLGLGLGCFGGLDMDSVGMDVGKELEDAAPDHVALPLDGSLLPREPDRQVHAEPIPTFPPPLRSSVNSTTSNWPVAVDCQKPQASSYSPCLTDEDPTWSRRQTPLSTIIPLPPAGTTEMSEPNLEGMSARERNALKRKRKAFGKTSVSTSSGTISNSLPGHINTSQGVTHDGTTLNSTPVKLRIVEQLGSLPGESASRIAVPALPFSTRQSTSRQSTSWLEGDLAASPASPLHAPDNIVIIDPGAKSRAAAELAKQSNGGAIDTSPEPPKSDSRLQYVEGEWPFASFVEILMIDMFSSQWEFRHGAALGLIPILKIQGFGAGKSVGSTQSSNTHFHQLWMEDLGLRLICLMSLDRFGDYVGDQVVAPVRETGAQGIGLVGRWLDRDRLGRILEVLRGMVEQSNVKSPGQRGYAWQVRHAGLLGIKYLVAVKIDVLRCDHTAGFSLRDSASPIKAEDTDLKPFLAKDADTIPISPHLSKVYSRTNLLSSIVQSSLIGLRDQDDDVRAAASGTLLPVTDIIVKTLPTMLTELLDVLWDALGSSRDDLSSSVGNIMDLLGESYSALPRVEMEH